MVLDQSKQLELVSAAADSLHHRERLIILWNPQCTIFWLIFFQIWGINLSITSSSTSNSKGCLRRSAIFSFAWGPWLDRPYYFWAILSIPVKLGWLLGICPIWLSRYLLESKPVALLLIQKGYFLLHLSAASCNRIGQHPEEKTNFSGWPSRNALATPPTWHSSALPAHQTAGDYLC